MKYYFISCFILLICSCSSQKHVRKKGGIEYQETQQVAVISPYKTVLVPALLEEISGLLVGKNQFWGFNDSGGRAEIYSLAGEPNAKITQTISLKNIKNVDFESIARSDSQIFVGDFGNNLGNREDLTIYYFNEEMLTDEASQTIDVKAIEFYFPEQSDFSNQNRDHDFDCEAMIYHNGLLHLFTKEWKSTQTHHYTVEIKPGKQAAKLIETYDAGFLITGADAVNENGQTIFGLIGYTQEGEVYFVKNIIDSNSNQFFTSSLTKEYIGSSIDLGQVEGIAFTSFHEFCISAERFTYGDANVPEHIACYELERN